MSKKKLKIDLEMMANYTEALEIELQLAHDDNEELQIELGKIKTVKAIAMDQIVELQKHIEMLNRQLLQLDAAIDRKDEENNVLKRMYRDDIINNYVER